MSAAQAALAGEDSVNRGIEFEQDIENMLERRTAGLESRRDVLRRRLLLSAPGQKSSWALILKNRPTVIDSGFIYVGPYVC